MTTATGPDYVSYLRKSKGRKAVKQQRTLTRTYVGRHGGNLLREFRDDDQTAYQKVGGAKPRRDDFAAMLVMLVGNPGLRVVAYHADRLTRNDEDTAALIRVCSKNGNPVETVSGGAYDLTTANGRKRLRGDANDAIYEVDHMTERILEGRAVVAAEGRWLGGKRPFGWELDPAPVDETGKPWLDEDGKPMAGILRPRQPEAQALAQAHHDLLAGKTTYRISREWNERGIRTSLGAAWNPSEVRRVLLRARNAGLVEYQGQITDVTATWPRIVDEPTWRKVAAKLRSPDRRRTPGPQRRHMLSGIALCGVCGERMTCTSKAGGRLVYTCRKENTGCHAARDQVALDDFVTRLVLARLSREDARDLLKVRDEGPDVPALYREADSIRERMREQHRLQVQEVITVSMLVEAMTHLKAELGEVQRQIDAAEQADLVAPMLRNPAAVWADMDVDQRSALIRAMMTVTVQVGAKGRPAGWKPGTTYFRPELIKIDWKR